MARALEDDRLMTFTEEPNQPKQTKKEGEHVRSILLAMSLKSQSSPHDLFIAKDNVTLDEGLALRAPLCNP